jgi:hypothetical protein
MYHISTMDRSSHRKTSVYHRAYTRSLGVEVEQEQQKIASSECILWVCGSGKVLKIACNRSVKTARKEGAHRPR